MAGRAAQALDKKSGQGNVSHLINLFRRIQGRADAFLGTGCQHRSGRSSS